MKNLTVKKTVRILTKNFNPVYYILNQTIKFSTQKTMNPDSHTEK